MLTAAASAVSARVRSMGFTLTEMLVALAIVAVSASLGAPSLARMGANNKVRGEAESLLNGLNFARAEALRRNSAVTLSLTPGGTGWTVTQVSPAVTLQTHSSPDAAGTVLASSTASTAVTFLSTGLLQSGSQMNQVTVSNALEGTQARRISIFGGGLIRMCDPAVNEANDPRRC